MIRHCVYITTNLINGKQYVGDHSTTNINDNYLGSGKHLLRAIKKYGRKNFAKEILETFETKEEAFNDQSKYIKLYNTLTPYGYNISPKGGHQVIGGLSKVTKQKISENNSRFWLGKKITEEVKNKNREAHLGKKLSEEHKKKIGDSLRGFKHSKESLKNRKRRKVTNDMIEDILRIKNEGISALETHNKYPKISIRTIYSIRSHEITRHDR